MQKINYSLIVSDFDGTLVNDDGSISESNKEAISKYRRDGGKFAISTGRLPNGILRRAKELGLSGAVSACQGSLIVDIESEEILFKGTIPNALAVKICKKMEAMGLHIHVYDVWEYYSNMDDDALKLYEGLTQTKAQLVLEKPLSVFLAEKGFDVCKFLVMVAPEDNDRVLEQLKTEKYPECCVTRSSKFLVEVINAKYSKGTAVQYLADYYGVPVEKTIGVGDQWNDIPMIEKAGLGIAVKNADEKLKENADVILEYTNEENAIAKLIEKFGYVEE